MSIKQDSKTIVRNIVAIPLTATATGLEVVAKVSDTGLSILRGSPKFLGDVAGIFGTFVSGAINHEATPQEAERIYQDLTLEKMMQSLKSGAAEACQNWGKGWNEER
jgi:hypothetical protein